MAPPLARPDRFTPLAGAAAAAAWLLWCVAWFDAGEAWRPPGLAALPRLALLLPRKYSELRVVFSGDRPLIW